MNRQLKNIKKSIFYSIAVCLFLLQTIEANIFFQEPLPACCDAEGTNKNIIIQNEKKDWLLMIYMAADNDLRNFAIHNLKQLAAVGSNKHITIVVHLDIRITGNQKITRCYYIEHNKITEINRDDTTVTPMDSGNPETLISFCNWCIETYPANYHALILWNHGTGAINPLNKHISPSRLFSFNTHKNKFELNRSIGFLDVLGVEDLFHRGICWDSSTGNYLNDQKLTHALKTIVNGPLNHKKFDIIGFDACLMSMIEVGSIIKDYAHIMLGSQEVVLGTGLNYELALSPFTTHSPDHTDLAKHIVETYALTYEKITDDFTLSAIALDHIDAFKAVINNISELLMEILKTAKLSSTLDAIWKSHHKKFCTHFDEPSYIDLHHFLENLKKNSSQITGSTELKNNLLNEINKAQGLINKMVIANRFGKNLTGARGISIYFPEKKIYPSYPETVFAKDSKWPLFLSQYHRAKQQGPNRIQTIELDCH